MNILEETQKLITKYDLRPNSYVSENPWKRKRESGDWSGKDDPYFVKSGQLEAAIKTSWEDRVVPYYSGISLWGYPAKWSKTLLEFLSLLMIDSPDFKIYNLKGKWGGLRFYPENVTEDAQKSIRLLEEAMYDEKLIY